jgi:hypothetical protein
MLTYLLCADFVSTSRTLQEELLSHRRLYFFEDQAAFVCRGMMCCEAQGAVELADGTPDMDLYSSISLKAAAKFNSPQIQTYNDVLAHICNLIVSYSQRHLSYDSDRLRAMAGIFRVYEEGAHPCYNIQGLSLVIHRGSTLSKAIMFMDALSWEQWKYDGTHRKKQFPSWTWASWTGPVTFWDQHIIMADKIDIFDINLRTINFGYEDGSNSTLIELIECLAASHAEISGDRHASRLRRKFGGPEDTQKQGKDFTVPKTISFCAPTVIREHFRFSTSKDWRTGTLWGMRLVSLTLDTMSFSPTEFLEGLTAGTMACILLQVAGSSMYRSRIAAYMMIIEWQDEIEAQRVCVLKAGGPKKHSDRLKESLSKVGWIEIRLA